jgi:hypothetical protein
MKYPSFYSDHLIDGQSAASGNHQRKAHDDDGEIVIPAAFEALGRSYPVNRPGPIPFGTVGAFCFGRNPMMLLPVGGMLTGKGVPAP